ncbi:FIST C-terminal domain-containing protein, partial [Patescibacteria group bacterium]|nr:FIST C-terminal domain-containing protein [Patescibacteria group bacterium]
AIHFEKAKLEFSKVNIENADQSETKGKELANSLPKENLVHVMVFSDGLKVNGTSLVKGLTDNLPNSVAITGGLVGDGADFKKTVIGLDEVPNSGNIVLIGFYGESLKISYGSLGGWDSFGPTRLITKSKNNVLYELDGKPALSLYKKYLGDQAKDLPSSGLLFPLNLYLETENGGKVEVVRTLLAVDEKEQSMTFAGDLPEGSYVSLMKANFDKLVAGAKGAATMSKEAFIDTEPDLAILISCIGRKLVLKDKIEKETEAVRKEFGAGTAMIGFYSYGEISPMSPTEKQCQLHNQTMTITTFKEV